MAAMAMSNWLHLTVYKFSREGSQELIRLFDYSMAQEPSVRCRYLLEDMMFEIDCPSKLGDAPYATFAKLCGTYTENNSQCTTKIWRLIETSAGPSLDVDFEDYVLDDEDDEEDQDETPTEAEPKLVDDAEVEHDDGTAGHIWTPAHPETDVVAMFSDSILEIVTLDSGCPMKVDAEKRHIVVQGLPFLTASRKLSVIERKAYRKKATAHYIEGEKQGDVLVELQPLVDQSDYLLYRTLVSTELDELVKALPRARVFRMILGDIRIEPCKLKSQYEVNELSKVWNQVAFAEFDNPQSPLKKSTSTPISREIGSPLPISFGPEPFTPTRKSRSNTPPAYVGISHPDGTVDTASIEGTQHDAPLFETISKVSSTASEGTRTREPQLTVLPHNVSAATEESARTTVAQSQLSSYSGDVAEWAIAVANLGPPNAAAIGRGKTLLGRPQKIERTDRTKDYDLHFPVKPGEYVVRPSIATPRASSPAMLAENIPRSGDAQLQGVAASSNTGFTLGSLFDGRLLPDGRPTRTMPRAIPLSYDETSFNSQHDWEGIVVAAPAGLSGLPDLSYMSEAVPFDAEHNASPPLGYEGPLLPRIRENVPTSSPAPSTFDGPTLRGNREETYADVANMADTSNELVHMSNVEDLIDFEPNDEVDDNNHLIDLSDEDPHPIDEVVASGNYRFNFWRHLTNSGDEIGLMGPDNRLQIRNTASQVVHVNSRNEMDLAGFNEGTYASVPESQQQSHGELMVQSFADHNPVETGPMSSVGSQDSLYSGSTLLSLRPAATNDPSAVVIYSADNHGFDQINGSEIYERLQPVAEADSRRVHRTMRQRKPKNKGKKGSHVNTSGLERPDPPPLPRPTTVRKSSLPPSASKPRIANVSNAVPTTQPARKYNDVLLQILDCARSEQGKIGIEVQLGQALFDKFRTSDAQNFAQSKMRKEKFEDRLTGYLDSDQIHLHFSKRLTTSLTEACELVVPSLFDQSPSSVAIYEFVLSDKHNKEVRVSISEGSNDVQVVTPEIDLGHVYLHFPRRVWDARVMVAARKDYQISEAVEQFVNTISVGAGEEEFEGKMHQVMRIKYRVESKEINVREVYCKRRFRHNTIERGLEDVVLEVTEVRKLSLAQNENDRAAWIAKSGFPSVMADEHCLWFEGKLQVLPNNLLAQNLTLQLGDEATWKPEEILDELNGLKPLVEQLVTRMDGIGRSNKGPRGSLLDVAALKNKDEVRRNERVGRFAPFW